VRERGALHSSKLTEATSTQDRIGFRETAAHESNQVFTRDINACECDETRPLVPCAVGAQRTIAGVRRREVEVLSEREESCRLPLACPAPCLKKKGTSGFLAAVEDPVPNPVRIEERRAHGTAMRPPAIIPAQVLLSVTHRSRRSPPEAARPRASTAGGSVGIAHARAAHVCDPLTLTTPPDVLPLRRERSGPAS